MVNLPSRIQLLQRMHLFNGLSDPQLTAVAEELVELSFETGSKVFEQGSRADNFYLVYSGKVRIVRRENKRERVLAVLVKGDYFGEGALVSNRVRTATVYVEQDAILLALSREHFHNLLRKAPKLKTNLDVSISSRALARKLNFKWVRQDEVIYFLARKHPIVLYRMLMGPAFLLLVPIILAFFWMMTTAVTPLVLAVAVLLYDIGWGIWNYIDWGNDYYVVTNQRVVYLEKVIGIHESRKEAPLSTVLSVGVETDMYGRMMDYGNVVVRTFVGRIDFAHVNHPSQAAKMVEEHWNRAKQGSLEAEKDAMKQAIRSRLGLPVPTKQAEAEAPVPAKVKSIYKPSIWRILGASLFKMRLEDSGMITYRKHWIVFFLKIWWILLFWLVLIGFAVYMGFRSFGAAGAGSSFTTWALVALFISLYPAWRIIYNYLDWANDIFQVTSDQIIDIDRKPFGTEERRAAPLENILSTEFKRVGFLGYVFNFGTVFITVGGTQLGFEDVWDPAAVQQDIDQRRMARMAAKKEGEVKAERERMAEWLATYHRAADEFRTLEDLNKPE